MTLDQRSEKGLRCSDCWSRRFWLTVSTPRSRLMVARPAMLGRSCGTEIAFNVCSRTIRGQHAGTRRTMDLRGVEGCLRLVGALFALAGRRPSPRELPAFPGIALTLDRTRFTGRDSSGVRQACAGGAESVPKPPVGVLTRCSTFK